MTDINACIKDCWFLASPCEYQKQTASLLYLQIHSHHLTAPRAVTDHSLHHAVPTTTAAAAAAAAATATAISAAAISAAAVHDTWRYH